MRPFLFLIAACASTHVDVAPDAAVAPPAAAPAGPFGGVFGADLPLPVVQTYHSTKTRGRIEADLGKIFASGHVAHLNLEPSGYTTYSVAALAPDLHANALEIASALQAHPDSRVIVTFGAEMNGSWTDWGCLPPPAFIALWRAAHDTVTDALAVDPRRVRWAFGPSSTSSCESPLAYYPGHAYVDLLGLSAYRSGSASVEDAVLAPVDALFAGYPTAWQDSRFVLLQTGSRDLPDRDAWIASLAAHAAADPRFAGVIYFDAADWAAPPSSLAALPAATTDSIFEPYFRDVPASRDEFAAIQALRADGITSGCASSPPEFCPDDAIRAADAQTLVARALGETITLADPVTEAALSQALGLPAGRPVVATRARAAVLVQSKR